MSPIYDQAAIKAETKRRARLAMAKAAAKNPGQYYAAVRHVLLSSLHDKQRNIVAQIESGQRYISLCCSRRAGKTHLLATLVLLLLMDMKFGQDIVFVAPTMKRGKEILWSEVERLVDEFCLPWHKTHTTGTIKTDSGAYFRIVGLDKKKQIGRVARGGNTRAVLADEVQEYWNLLSEFIAAASPALGQTRGIFVASGTPGAAMSGYWYDICHGAEGFATHHWTLLDNPHLGRPAEDILREERALKGYADDHPDYVREWLGKWTRDSNKLVVEYDPRRNVVDAIAGYDVAVWRHFIGVDYGYNDPSAWVVLAAHPHSSNVFVVHAEKHAGMTADAIAEKTQELRARFRPQAIVADSASGGATFIASFNARYGAAAGVRMRHAKKHDKNGSISVLNTEARCGRLKLVRAATLDLAAEIEVLQWDDEHRTKIAEGADFPDHLFDALRYGLMEFSAWRHRAQPSTEKTEAELESERIEARNRAAREERDGWADVG